MLTNLAILTECEFDLPLGLLFKTYERPALVEHWMGTKVLKLENKKHGRLQLPFAKFLGVILILISKFPLLKEWAYAGSFSG